MIRSITRIALSGAALALMISAAEAKPPFAEKEGKKCNYCHAPAPPKLNYRGLYYKANSLTFAKFDDAGEAKKAGVEVGPDPDPKPKSWTAPDAKPAEAPKPEAPKAPEAPKGPSVADLKKKADAAAAAFKKKPKDAKLKLVYAQALAELGHGQMLDQSVPPRLRYPGALKTLRQAKVLDPKNKLANEDIKAIEDAYKSMGMPIPK